MNFDVVIPTANNIASKKFSLYFTIRSILAQSIQPKQIIVVENLDIDATRQILNKEFGDLIIVIDGTHKSENISYARNLGASYCNNEVILFMDDDVIIGKNDIFKIVIENMEHIDFYCGAKRFWTNTEWDKIIDKSYPMNHIQLILNAKSFLPKSIDRYSGKQSFHEYSYIGHFGAIKRSTFTIMKGFDENFQSWSHQDTDLMMRLCVEKCHFRLMNSDGIFIYHLSHAADKSKSKERNKDLFDSKQNELGVKFNVNHFFGNFDDDSYSILS